MNTAPIAVVKASSALVGPLQTVTLDGSESADPEEQPLTYIWTQVAGDLVVLDDPAAALVSFVAPDRPQSLVFSLTVKDGVHESLAAAVQIRVSTNAEPVATLEPLGQAIAGATITLDATASRDPEEQPLTYAWASPSHPTLVFSATATPNIAVPNTPGETLRITLTVSDGVLTSGPVEVQAVIEAGDASAVFVDAAAPCSADCNGTRAKPYKQIMPGYVKAKLEGKPVLVAPGYYQPLALDQGAVIEGRCDPQNGWTCGDTAAPTVIEAGDADPYAVTIPAPNDVPVVLRRLHILGGSGQALAIGTTTVGAVLCNSCSVTIEDSYLEVNGAGANCDTSRVIDVAPTQRPVRIKDSTLLMGRAGRNHGVYASGAGDLEIDNVTIRSKTDVRNGAPSPLLYRNALVTLYGGTVARLKRSRLEIDAGQEHRFAHAIDLIINSMANTKPSLLASGNVFWFKGFAGAWGPSDGPPGTQPRRSEANVMIWYFDAEQATFVNNTFLGNAAAKAPAVNCLQNGMDEACSAVSLLYGETAPGDFAFVNNYFATLYRLVWNDSYSRYVTFKNNTVAPDVPVLSDGAAIGPTGDPHVLGDGHLEGAASYGAPDQLGEGNAVADCLLKDAANGDVHLLAGSPCIDSGGFDRDALASDIDGVARPSGAAIDRGAYEVAK